MGRDKAGLIIDGQPLWQRQLATLQELHPREIFISGKRDGPYAGAGIEIVPDITPGLGPLSALEAVLQRTSCPLVLVLAIDLPAMNAEFLSRLASLATAHGRGVVPSLGAWFEPLAAIYTPTCLPLVRRHLRRDDRSMQSFVREALSAHLVIHFEVAADDRGLFRNVNTPADLRES
jgi:molybdopterin-guanine dinucleotide biosynthesis protein A